jgi:L-alanine-DL-glutamate epimerase-like enolase superfamily enzyme
MTSTIARRRDAAATPLAGKYKIAEIRWFPVLEPVAGSRYTVLRVKTRSGLARWAGCAQVAAQDAIALEKTWAGKPATLYAAIDRNSPFGRSIWRCWISSIPQAASRNQGKASQNQVQALIKQPPDDRDFVLSAHGSFTPGDAASVAQSVQSSHPLWFDEPCAVSNREVLRKDL